MPFQSYIVPPSIKNEHTDDNNHTAVPLLDVQISFKTTEFQRKSNAVGIFVGVDHAMLVVTALMAGDLDATDAFASLFVLGIIFRFVAGSFDGSACRWSRLWSMWLIIVKTLQVS